MGKIEIQKYDSVKIYKISRNILERLPKYDTFGYSVYFSRDSHKIVHKYVCSAEVHSSLLFVVDGIRKATLVIFIMNRY